MADANEGSQASADCAQEYEFRQDVYALISLYMDTLSPKQTSDILRDVANEETKRQM